MPGEGLGGRDSDERERLLVGRAPRFPDHRFRTQAVRVPGEGPRGAASRREGVTSHGCLPFFFPLPYYENMQLSNILECIHQVNLHSELTHANLYEGSLLSRIARKASPATFPSSGTQPGPATRGGAKGPHRDSAQSQPSSQTTGKLISRD